MKSPLAKRLFAADGVASVFFGSDFVTITKKDEYSWAVLKPDVFAAIMDFYSSGALANSPTPRTDSSLAACTYGNVAARLLSRGPRRATRCAVPPPAPGEPVVSSSEALAASDTAIHPDDSEVRRRAGLEALEHTYGHAWREQGCACCRVTVLAAPRLASAAR
jgi:hypothetical protein